MPTGYTSTLHDGEQSFEEFIWSCARAMGALILMRDDASDTPIPKRFEPSKYEVERVEKARTDLARVIAMSDDEWVAEQAVKAAEHATHQMEYRQNQERMEARYRAMLDRVTAWEPPTVEHVGFRDFMIEQLESSIKFDCTPHDWPYKALSHAEGITDAEETLARAEKYLAEDIERTEGRNGWLAALRESVPPSDAMAEA